MTLAPLDIACPQCGSHDVVYSCKPDCCFNHVCGQCYTTFEPVTTKVGEFSGDLGSLPADPDPSGPTAACARCGEILLFAMSVDDAPAKIVKIVCASCKALLELTLTEVVPG